MYTPGPSDRPDKSFYHHTGLKVLTGLISGQVKEGEKGSVHTRVCRNHSKDATPGGRPTGSWDDEEEEAGSDVGGRSEGGCQCVWSQGEE